MKKVTFLLTLALLVIYGCSQESDSISESETQNLVINNNSIRASNSGPSANGHGTLDLENLPPDGEGFRQFTFHAKEKKNGNVTGSGVLTYIGGAENIKFDIDCLTVDGNIASMAGVVTHHAQNPENEGLRCWFKVIDNGEGSSADDEISLFYYSNVDCINISVPIYSIEGGNIQVRE